MKSEPTKDRTAQKLHSHYAEWFTGDGAKVEFLLTRSIGRVEDVMVFVDGAIKRPDKDGTAYDYKIRGHTSGYAGDKNAIKFAVAPANTKNVAVLIIST